MREEEGEGGREERMEEERVEGPCKMFVYKGYAMA